MKLKKDILVYIPFLVISLILSSCIKDNRDDCDNEIIPGNQVQIDLAHTPMCYVGDDEEEVIERVDLFIFNSDGYFIDRITEYPKMSNTNYFINLALEPGNYEIVAWGNLMTGYHMTPTNPIPGETNINEMYVHVDSDGDNSVGFSPHVLYFSNLSDITITSTGNQTFNMDLNHDIHKFNITIEGLTIPTGLLDVIISDSHGSFDFYNTPATNRLNYTNSCTSDADARFQASMVTMQLTGEHETYLIIYDPTSDRILYEVDLIDLINILKAQGIDIELESDCTIDIVLNFNSDMKVDVIINGWKVIEDDQQIYI